MKMWGKKWGGTNIPLPPQAKRWGANAPLAPPPPPPLPTPVIYIYSVMPSLVTKRMLVTTGSSYDTGSRDFAFAV